MASHVILQSNSKIYSISFVVVDRFLNFPFISTVKGSLTVPIYLASSQNMRLVTYNLFMSADSENFNLLCYKASMKSNFKFLRYPGTLSHASCTDSPH